MLALLCIALFATVLLLTATVPVIYLWKELNTKNRIGCLFALFVMYVIIGLNVAAVMQHEGVM